MDPTIQGMDSTTQGMDPMDTGAMPLDLFLVRHGESEGNVALDAAKRGDRRLLTPEYLARSTADYRLTGKGRAQAAAAGRWVRSWMEEVGIERFDRLYCSPFVRARETAGLLDVPDAAWQLESLLRERDFGLWEGHSKSESAKKYPWSFEYRRRHKFLWRPECGESTADIDMRVREILGTLAREMAGRRVLCVTHEDVMWAFRYRLEKMTIDEWLEREEAEDPPIVNCGILHFSRTTADGWVAEKFARMRLVDPLDPESSTWTDIERPRFANRDLLEQVEELPHLWDGRYA